MEDLSEYFGSEKEKLCAFYRGIIIHHVINIEELIDIYLIAYYLRPKIPKYTSGLGIFDLQIEYQEKEEEFGHTILEKENFNLNFKLAAWFFILNKHCKDFLDKHKRFKKSIIELIDLRNDFAHRKLDEKLCDLEKQEITLVYKTADRMKPKTEKIIMNPVRLKVFLVKYVYAIDCLCKSAQIVLDKEVKSSIDDYLDKGKKKEE